MNINVFVCVWAPNEITCKTFVTRSLSLCIQECQVSHAVPVRRLDLVISGKGTSLCGAWIQAGAKENHEGKEYTILSGATYFSRN
jgi:hypothetical protein